MTSIQDMLDEGGDKPGNSTPTPGINDMEIESLQVGGIIEDKYGNKWQVPVNATDDLDDLYAGEPYKNLPDDLKNFHVQLISKDSIMDYTQRGFVPVRQEEMGIPKELIRDMGNPLDTYHCIGDSVLVKIPKAIAEILERRKIKLTKDRLKQIEPTKKMIAEANRKGFAIKVEHEQAVDRVDPSRRQGLYVEEENE